MGVVVGERGVLVERAHVCCESNGRLFVPLFAPACLLAADSALLSPTTSAMTQGVLPSVLAAAIISLILSSAFITTTSAATASVSVATYVPVQRVPNKHHQRGAHVLCLHVGVSSQHQHHVRASSNREHGQLLRGLLSAARLPVPHERALRSDTITQR